MSLPQPIVTSQLGTVNNIIQVKKTDFEVFDALMVDSQKCSDVSGMNAVILYMHVHVGALPSRRTLLPLFLAFELKPPQQVDAYSHRTNPWLCPVRLLVFCPKGAMSHGAGMDTDGRSWDRASAGLRLGARLKRPWRNVWVGA